MVAIRQRTLSPKPEARLYKPTLTPIACGYFLALLQRACTSLYLISFSVAQPISPIRICRTENCNQPPLVVRLIVLILCRVLGTCRCVYVKYIYIYVYNIYLYIYIFIYLYIYYIYIFIYLYIYIFIYLYIIYLYIYIFIYLYIYMFICLYIYIFIYIHYIYYIILYYMI